MSSQKNPETSKKVLPPYNKIPLFWQIVVGTFSGFMVSPINTIVDKSVIENANGKTPLWQGVWKGFRSLFTTPQIFLKSYEFKWIFFVYASTYISSNVADHVEIKGMDPAFVKLMMSFLVNTSASLVKDKALAQAFGNQTSRTFPVSSFGLFLMRDIVAMASAFTIPPILGLKISEYFDLDTKTGLRLGQLTSPLLVQIVGTPLHLLGLDIYNRQNLSMKERMAYLKSIYWNSLFLRMLRFLPAYGLGGIANMELRSYFADKYGNKN